MTRKLHIGLVSLAALAVGAVVPLALPSSAQTTSGCTVSASDQAIDAEEQKLLDLINQYRVANGKNQLVFNTDVTRAAAWLSQDMATKNYFSHTDSNGRGMGPRLTWCGLSYSNAAENIAAGYTDAQGVFDGWKASSGHNANMLRDGVTAAGIGRAYNATSQWKWYWTLDETNTATSASTTTTTRPATTTTTAKPATTTTTAAPTTTTTAPPATTTTTRPPRCVQTPYGLRCY
jgi:uncharacterized protein YkwD